MSNNSQIANGLHMVKTSGYGPFRRLTIPKPLADALAIPNGAYLGVQVIGECIVVVKLTDVTPDGAQAEMNAAFKRAVKAWEKAKP